MNKCNISLTRTDFARLMRSYSNQSNKTVDRHVWKRIKATTIDPNTTGYKVIFDRNINVAYIDAVSRRGGTRFSSNTHPTLVEFINHIFQENHMGRPIDVSVQGTSSNTYPAHNSRLDSVTMKADYMGASSLSNVSNAISMMSDSAKTALDGIQTLTINANDFYESVKTSKIADLADVAISPVNGNWGTISITSDVDCLKADINGIRKELDKLTKKDEENKNMMFNFDFGKVTSDAVRVSMYGVAVKSVDGRYVSYDSKTHSIMDVEILNMPAGDFLYKMPVAIKDIKAGDVVIHNRVPMFVVETHESTLKVIDIREGSEKEIYLTKSPFGFNFATKVVSLMDMTGGKADESNPFGNMLPFMLMGENKDFDPMMLMLMNGGKMDMSNPMMMYFLMKDTNHKDMLPLLMMMNAKG